MYYFEKLVISVTVYLPLSGRIEKVQPNLTEAFQQRCQSWEIKKRETILTVCKLQAEVQPSVPKVASCHQQVNICFHR